MTLPHTTGRLSQAPFYGQDIHSPPFVLPLNPTRFTARQTQSLPESSGDFASENAATMISSLFNLQGSVSAKSRVLYEEN